MKNLQSTSIDRLIKIMGNLDAPCQSNLLEYIASWSIILALLIIVYVHYPQLFSNPPHASFMDIHKLRCEKNQIGGDSTSNCMTPQFPRPLHHFLQ